MSNIKVSVIVPTYNDEKYIKRCINSILNQTLAEIEIIIIDDGSTDSSPAICDQYAKDYPDKIIVKHTENQGLGLTRNYGVTFAKGEHIAFVDSDDWIEKEMYKEMYEKAMQDDCDIVICDIFYYDVAKNVINRKYSINDYDGKFDLKEYIVYGYLFNSAVNKLYKKEIWQKYKFKKMLFEEYELIPTLITYNDKISYLPKAFYTYYRRPNSIATSTNNINTLDIIQSFKNMLSNSNPGYMQEIECFSAISLLWNMDYRYLHKAEFVELVHELGDRFKTNKLILSDPEARKILTYLDVDVIPRKIFYPNFSNDTLLEHNIKCIESYSDFTRDFEIIPLNCENCDINHAPSSVQIAFKEKNYKFVGDYFKLKMVYEFGGIAIDTNISLNSPIGSLRCEKTFFSFANKENLSDSIFGSLPKTEVVKKLLCTYDETNVFGDNTESLAERLHDVLVYYYNLIPRGWTQRLNKNITVFKADILQYKMDETNIACINFPHSTSVELLGCQIVDSNLLNYFKSDVVTFLAERDKLRKELELANKKIQKLTNTPTLLPVADKKALSRMKYLDKQLKIMRSEVHRLKHSKSWRITRPLRYFFNLFRTNKHTKEEMD